MELIKSSLYYQKNVIPEISFTWILILVCACVKKSVGKVLSDFSELLQPFEDCCPAPLPKFLFIPKGREQKVYFCMCGVMPIYLSITARTAAINQPITRIHSSHKTPRIYNKIHIYIYFLLFRMNSYELPKFHK